MDYKIFPGPAFSRKGGELYERFTIHLSPARAATHVADRLCDRGWGVDEVRLNYNLSQATVHTYAASRADNAERLEADLRSVWAHLVLLAASGEGPLAFEG